MNKVFSALMMLLAFNFSFAGEIIRDAETSTIGNTANGNDDFYIKVKNGTGVCNGNIIFPREAAPSAEYHARAYSLALTAITTKNTKVRVVNFDSQGCTYASYIEMSN